MNIQTVADNLRFKIASKEELLVRYTQMRDYFPKENVLNLSLLDRYWRNVTSETKVSIEELTHILRDVEQCIEVEE